MLVFLLLLGYAAMGFWFDRQIASHQRAGTAAAAGLDARGGIGPGNRLGRGAGLRAAHDGDRRHRNRLSHAHASAWGWLVADAAFFALAALAEEVAFRGYAFQRFVHAVGPSGATLGFAAIYAMVQAFTPGASHASFAVSMVFTFLLSAAYLRTRALWVGWGLNFGWKASRALRLRARGQRRQQPFASSSKAIPWALSGSPAAAYGLDGSWLACLFFLRRCPWSSASRAT